MDFVEVVAGRVEPSWQQLAELLARPHRGGGFIPAERGNVLVRVARDGPFGIGSEVFGTHRDQYGHRNPPKRPAPWAQSRTSAGVCRLPTTVSSQPPAVIR